MTGSKSSIVLMLLSVFGGPSSPSVRDALMDNFPVTGLKSLQRQGTNYFFKTPQGRVAIRIRLVTLGGVLWESAHFDGCFLQCSGCSSRSSYRPVGTGGWHNIRRTSRCKEQLFGCRLVEWRRLGRCRSRGPAG
jgi:hypothetical protein